LLRIRATLESDRRRMLQAKGILTLADDESTLLAEATGVFLPIASPVMEQILQDYPGLQGFMEQR
jgi:hypothetical protein